MAERTSSSEANPGAANLIRSVDDSRLRTALDHIRQALEGLRFGEVSVIVQDGVVVQLERRERTRFQR